MNLNKLFSNDALLFFLKFLKDPTQIGGITPSSKTLARVMTKYISEENEPRHYLEVGPGTGVFTQMVVDKLGVKDKLDVIELDPEFSQRLKEKYKSNRMVGVYTENILNWNPGYRYDVILSSLPLNALKKQILLKTYQKFTELAKPGGIISYFEYLGLQGIKKMFLKPEARDDFVQVRELMTAFTTEHEIHAQKVWGNFPPAIVHHCQTPRDRNEN